MSKKAALLDTAERLARRKGFDAFSFADLGKDVGIQKASIHYHFPSKADLARDLIVRYRENFVHELTKIAGTNGNAANQLGAYLKLYRAALEDGESLCLCVSFSSAPESFRDDVKQELAAFHDLSLTWLTDRFALAETDKSLAHLADPAAEAAALLALVEGAQILARSSKDVQKFDQATAAFATRLST